MWCFQESCLWGHDFSAKTRIRCKRRPQKCLGGITFWLERQTIARALNQYSTWKASEDECCWTKVEIDSRTGCFQILLLCLYLDVFFILFCFILNWRMIVLQFCIGFWGTTMKISHNWEFWQNMVHWRREFQSHFRFLPQEPHEQ